MKTIEKNVSIKAGPGTLHRESTFRRKTEVLDSDLDHFLDSYRSPQKVKCSNNNIDEIRKSNTLVEKLKHISLPIKLSPRKDSSISPKGKVKLNPISIQNIEESTLYNNNNRQRSMASSSRFSLMRTSSCNSNSNYMHELQVEEAPVRSVSQWTASDEELLIFAKTKKLSETASLAMALNTKEEEEQCSHALEQQQQKLTRAAPGRSLNQKNHSRRRLVVHRTTTEGGQDISPTNSSSSSKNSQDNRSNLFQELLNNRNDSWQCPATTEELSAEKGYSINNDGQNSTCVVPIKSPPRRRKRTTTRTRLSPTQQPPLSSRTTLLEVPSLG